LLPKLASLTVTLFLAFLVLPLLLDVEVLFSLSDDVVLLLKMPFEMLLASDKVLASLIESALKGDEVGESSDDRRLKNEASRRLVDRRSLRGFD
jgi:hypothetical protein